MLIGHQPKEFLLAVSGLTVSFDGFKAVNDRDGHAAGDAALNRRHDGDHNHSRNEPARISSSCAS